MGKRKSESLGKPLVRSDIERVLRKKLKLTRHGAQAMVRAVFIVFSRNLVAGNTIAMRNVGEIRSKTLAARKHHMVVDTPQTKGTGSRMRNTPPRRILRFSPYNSLRKRMLNNLLVKIAGQKTC